MSPSFLFFVSSTTSQAAFYKVLSSPYPTGSSLQKYNLTNLTPPSLTFDPDAQTVPKNVSTTKHSKHTPLAAGPLCTRKHSPTIYSM